MNVELIVSLKDANTDEPIQTPDAKIDVLALIGWRWRPLDVKMRFVPEHMPDAKDAHWRGTITDLVEGTAIAVIAEVPGQYAKWISLSPTLTTREYQAVMSLQRLTLPAIVNPQITVNYRHTTMSLPEIVKQLRSRGYRNETGNLETDVAFRALEFLTGMERHDRGGDDE